MTDVRYVAHFIDEPAIGRGLEVLEAKAAGQEAQDSFCDRLLDYVEENQLDPHQMGQIVTKSQIYAGYRVLPSYEDEVVGTVNVVYRVHGEAITIYMIQVAAKKEK